jgi:hypothetical protein
MTKKSTPTRGGLRRNEEMNMANRIHSKHFGKAVSQCICGHWGDVSLGSRDGEHRGQTFEEATTGSEHAGFIGHGRCTVEGCDCEQFTWLRWLPNVEFIEVE